MSTKIKITPELDETKLREQLDNIEKSSEKINLNINSSSINNANKNMRQFNNTVSASNSVFGKLRNTISNTFSTGKIAMTGYLMVLNEIHKAGQNAKQTIQDIDKAITDLSIATNQSRESVAGLVKDYNNYAKTLKSTTTQITSAADDYLRAGKSMNEAQALIKDSIMLSKLGQLDSAEATEDLLATMNGFEMSIEEVEKALDAMVAIDMEAATSSGDIATALKYCASSADVAGLSFNKLAAMIGAVQDKTQQSAQTIGTFMNTLLSRYRDVKIGRFVDDDGESLSDVESVLGSLNIKLRDSKEEFRDFETVIDEVAQSWDSYSSVQQAAIAKAFSGTRQQNRFIALMEGYNKTLELTEVAANSAGTAVEKFNSAYLNSLEAKQNALQASFESMVINSDFDEIYSGILDATTALVDFINQTNALKGVFAGLAVSSGIKFFMSAKTGATEAYIALNKFSNALKIAKQTNIPTADFDKLLLLSNNLSASQMKLLLSSKSLSTAQKELILTNSGLSSAEAKLQLQTWGMVSAETGLTAATTTLGTAFKGLMSTLIANPLILITTFVSGAVMAYQSYNQKLEETRQKNIEASEAAIEHAKSLQELYAEYNRLASIQDKTITEEEEFKTAVENITKALSDKADVLEGLTAGTNEYADALSKATKEELLSASINATVGRKSAEEELQNNIWSEWSGSKVSIDSNSKGKALSEEAQKAVDIVSDALKEFETINRTWKNISWDISSDDAEKALEFYNSLLEAREKLVLVSENDETLLDTEIYSDLNTAINTMSDSLDTYIEQRYEEEKLYYMAQNSIPSTTEEYKAMEAAMMSAAGSSVDLQDKFKELLTTDFASLAVDVENVEGTVKDMANTVDTVDIDLSLSISETIDQLNTQLKPAFDSLKSAYEDIFTTDGFTLENVDLSMLDSIKSAIDEINKNNTGFYIDYSSFEELARVLTDTSSTADDVHNAINSLATEVVGALTPALSECSGENYKLIQSLLESMGIMNSEEVMVSSLGYSYAEYIAAKEEAAQSGFDLANATESEINAFVQEQIESGNCGEALALLQLKKVLVNSTTINTAADVQQIMNLASAASMGADVLAQLASAKSILSQVESGKVVSLSSYEKALGDIDAAKQKMLDWHPVEVKFDSNTSGAKSAGSNAGKAYKNAFQDELSDLGSTLSGVTKILDKQISKQQSAKNAAVNSLNEQKTAALEALRSEKEAAVETLEKERDLRIEVVEAQKKQYQEQIKLIDAEIKSKQKIIDSINEEIQAMRDANDQRKRELTLQEALYAQRRAEEQHNILQYSEEKGFTYVNDSSEARKAKEEVDQAKFEIDVANKQKQIDLIQKEIDLLNERKSEINDQISLLDEEADKINDHYSELISNTEKMYDQMIKDAEKYWDSMIKETEAYWDSIIKNVEEYKSRFEQLAELEENAKVIDGLKKLGITTEDIMNMSAEAFEKFKDEYVAALYGVYEGNESMQDSISEALGSIGEFEGAASSIEPVSDAIDDASSSMDNLSGSASTANQTVSDTASNLDTAATNAGTLRDNLSDVNDTVSDEETAFDSLKKTIDEVIQAINDKITAIKEEQNVVNIATSDEMADFILLRDKILEVKESIEQISTAVSTLDFTAVNNLTTSFRLLYDQLILVSNVLGAGMEGQGGENAAQGTVSSIASAIEALNDISLEDGIIAQFNNLKTAIDEVTAAIGGGDGESSGGEGQGGGSASGSSGANGGESEGGSGGSLTDAITQMGETANEVIGEPNAEGDGTVIGEFGSMKTAVNEVSEAIGIGGEEGSGGSEGGDDGTLIGSINDLGITTEEVVGERGEEGTIIGRFEEFRDVIGEADAHVKSISEGLDEIDGKEVECTIKIKIETSGGGLGGLGLVNGSMNLNSATYNAKYGAAHVEGTALVSGNWAVQSDEKSALMGELGYEVVVRNGRFFTVGDNGAEMVPIKKGEIVFNHEQSVQLLKNGHISGRGKAYADGTVGDKFASGVFRPLQPGDRMWDLTKKAEEYMKQTGEDIREMLAPVNTIQRDMEQMVQSINTINNISNSNNRMQNVVNEFHITLPNITDSTKADALLRDLQSIALKKEQFFNMR